MTIDFGKYRSKSFQEVYGFDPRYCRWLYTQELILTRNPELKAFLDEKFRGADVSYEPTFGKYKGRTINQILLLDRQYLEWLYSSPFSEKMTKLRADLAKIL